VTISFGAMQFLGRKPGPEIDSVRIQERACEPAKASDELIELARLASLAREFEEKLSKRLLRMRLAEAGIFDSGCRQGAPDIANTLKIIELHFDATPESQIESRNIGTRVPSCERA
jgi:hypothetical protein